MSNAAAGNALLIYNVAFDGSLTAAGSVPAGAKGVGAGLGSQGALALDSSGFVLFAVDAGSNEISVFSVPEGGTATLLSRVASGGARPISITVYKNLVYVLNGGGANNNITGFTFSSGKLTAIPNSTLALSAPSPNPAEISFSGDGKVLIVTEKNTNIIDTYPVGAGGVATGPITHTSLMPTPFGFNLANGNQIMVTEASSKTTSSVSSYTVGDDGSLIPITASVPANGGAACWLAVSKDGEYAYTSDFDTAQLSIYEVAANGTFTFVSTTPTGNGPADIALSASSNYLYLINDTDHTIGAFAIHADRSLTAIPGVSGLPAGASGLVFK